MTEQRSYLVGLKVDRVVSLVGLTAYEQEKTYNILSSNEAISNRNIRSIAQEMAIAGVTEIWSINSTKSVDELRDTFEKNSAFVYPMISTAGIKLYTATNQKTRKE